MKSCRQKSTGGEALSEADSHSVFCEYHFTFIDAVYDLQTLLLFIQGSFHSVCQENFFDMGLFRDAGYC